MQSSPLSNPTFVAEVWFPLPISRQVNKPDCRTDRPTDRPVSASKPAGLSGSDALVHPCICAVSYVGASDTDAVGASNTGPAGGQARGGLVRDRTAEAGGR